MAVDAPRLQETIFTEMGRRAFITPGVGVDPTNEYRDGNPRAGLARPRVQQTGRQDLAERNLIKVSLDYYIQGFCLSSITLRPSAFYAAAGLRTVAIRGAIWHAVRANLTAQRAAAPPAAALPACMSQGTRRHDHPGLEACQLELCGISACNLNQ